jgi:hypothetical protein
MSKAENRINNGVKWLACRNRNIDNENGIKIMAIIISIMGISEISMAMA